MRFLTFIAAVMIGLCGMAQNGRAHDPLTGGSVEVNGLNFLKGETLNGDEKIDTVAPQSPRQRSMTIYRVNVYSCHDRRGGLELVENIKTEVEALFPELSGKTHTDYSSPYFKMWVGWFYSEADANRVAADLKKKLRKYRKDINVSSRKVKKRSKSKTKEASPQLIENEDEARL